MATNIAVCHILISLLVVASIWKASLSLPLDYSEQNQNVEEPRKRTPVILVPGYGGSQIQAKLNKTTKPNVFCVLNSKDYFHLWVNIEALTNWYLFECLVDNMRLEYNITTGQTKNRDGVEIRVPGWGDTNSVEYLSQFHIKQTSYYFYVVDTLVRHLGYVRGKDVRGAPYDFRKPPPANPEFMADFKLLVESTYEMNNQTPVMLVGHSMGGVYTHQFLLQQSQAWKDKYVDSFVSVAAPFGGSMFALIAASTGDNLQIPTVRPSWVRPLQRSFTSTPFLFPAIGLWDNKEVVVSTPTMNYTVYDFEKLFEDMDYKEGHHMHKSASSDQTLATPLEKFTIAPGVKTLCVLATGFQTPERLEYPNGKPFPDGPPRMVSGEGDGTVNIRSLKVCSDWAGKQKQLVRTKEFHGLSDHLGIVRDAHFVNFMLDIVSKGDEYQQIWA